MKNNRKNSPGQHLPVRGRLDLAYAATLILALIMAGTSLSGLLFSDHLYQNIEIQQTFMPTDAVNLCIELPVLLMFMWLTKRGSLIGLLSWPGILFSILYIYIPYIICVPFGMLFIPYLLLVALSTYSLAGILARINGEELKHRLAGSVPARIPGIILTGLGVFIFFWQGYSILQALIHNVSPGNHEIAMWIADFTLAVPSLLIAGICLMQRKPFGYMVGGGLFFAYAVLSFGLIPFLIIQSRMNNASLDTGGIVAALIMTILCMIPFIYFIRGAALK